MRKQPEIEEIIKKFIRDELAAFPLMSVAKMRVRLYGYGCKAVYGPLDWSYVNKLMRKVRFENLARLDHTTRMDRLSALKERHRIITEKLMGIVDGRPRNDIYADKLLYPTDTERLAAAETIMKWDITAFFAEEQIRSIETRDKKDFAIPVEVNDFPTPSNSALKRLSKTLGSVPFQVQ